MSKLVINKYSVDKKELSVIFTFLCWLIVGFIICFVGISKTYALDYNNIGYIDNFTDILIDVTYETENNSLLTVEKTQEVYTEIKTLYINVSNYNFNANTHYQLELSLPNMTLNNANYYEVYDSNNNNCTVSNEFSTFNTAYPKWDFECKNNTNAITIKVGNRNNTAITDTGTFRWNYTYLRYTDTPIENTNQQIADNIINNQNQNTQDIINNNNQNTQDIIDSNKETQDVIKDQFNTCRDSLNLLKPYRDTYTYRGITFTSTNKGFVINGTISSDYEQSSATLFFGDLEAGTYTVNGIDGASNTKYQLAIRENGVNKRYLTTGKYTFTLAETTKVELVLFVYYSYGTFNNLLLPYQLVKGTVIGPYEAYGEQICTNKIDDTNDKLDDINGSLNNFNTTGATNDASNFFSNFTTDTFGLTSIITAPLSLINNLTSSSCSSLRLPLPYLDNKYLELPCMETIYSTYFGSFFSLYQTITFGIVSYWVIVRIFNQVKDFKNPDHDEIEVLDL